MDVSFTNVLEGARQYFQGLPAPSTGDSTALTDHSVTTSSISSTLPTSPGQHDHGTTSSICSASAVSTSSSASSQRTSQFSTDIRSSPQENGTTSTFWNPQVEPYPPQPTRVEVPDTRPGDESSALEPSSSSSITLIEMQPSIHPSTSTSDFAQNQTSTITLSNNNQHQACSDTAATSSSPNVHQVQGSQHLHSPGPVYQHLNNVTRTSYSSNEMLESIHSTNYQAVNDRQSQQTTPIVSQRIQYYPRYHHPDITKSAPVPFSQNSVYQSGNVTSPSSANIQLSATKSTPMEQSNASHVSGQTHCQQDQRVPNAYGNTSSQSSVGSSIYESSSTQNGYRVIGQQNQHNCVGTLNSTNSRSSQHNSEGFITHSSSSSSSPSCSTMNPCSPCHSGNSNHIPSSTSQNLPAHIPSSHLLATGSTPMHHRQNQQSSLQQQQQHPSRINASHSVSSVNSVNPISPINSNPYGGRIVMPHGGSASSSSNHSLEMPPPTAMTGYHSVASPHEIPHHATSSPQRQSPHIPTLHNPHAASPHHAVSPHNSFQPHSPTYPPPPPARSTPHTYSLPATSQHYQATSSYTGSPYAPLPQPSYHSFQKSPQPSQSQSGNYYAQQNRSHGQMYMQQQTPGIPLQPVCSGTSNTSSSSYHQSKPITYNGSESRKNSTEVGISYGCYRSTAAVSTQRNTNTHNLPPIAALSSYHSNRRESMVKVQPVQRQRMHSTNSTGKVSVVTSPTSSMTIPQRISDYPVASTGTISVNGRTTASSNVTYSNRFGTQQGYSSYATTIAPSHHGSNSSSSTTVSSIGTSARFSVPSTIQAYQSSDTNSRIDSSSYHHHQSIRANDGYSYKEYSYSNSSSSSIQSSPVMTVATSSQVSNGVRKRESPLDLSVKTIKTSADSTAQDDLELIAMDKQVSSSNLMSLRNNETRTTLLLPTQTASAPSLLPPPPPPPRPASASYANVDARLSNNETRSTTITTCIRTSTPQTVCAPKVDFLPDFNSAPLRHQHQQNPHENISRRNSTQQLYSSHSQSLSSQHATNTAPLPHMSTFKKTSLPVTPMFDSTTMPPAPLPSSYTSTSDTTSRLSRYPTQILDPSKMAMKTLPLQDYPSDSTKYYSSNKAKYSQSPTQRERTQMKRPSDSIYGAGGPSKQPRLDTWRLAIDKQIQQRLSTARALHEQQKKQEMNMPAPLPNGNLVTPNVYEQRSDNGYSSSESARYQQVYCDKRNYQEQKIIRISPSSYNHSMVSKPTHALPQQLAGGQTSYSSYRQSQRVVCPSSTPTSGQLPDQPSNTGADKRVLSLLRNSLENKQQREDQLNNQQPILTNNQQSFQNKVVAPIEPKTNVGRHNLSPFTAASLLERNSNTPPHYKFHVPKAVDSITQETPQSLYGSRINTSTSIPAKDTLLLSRGSENQIHRDKDDGLAAILAAKIRTKAELKQVDTGHFIGKSSTISSQDASSTPKEFDNPASTSTPQSGSSSGSPPKLTREKPGSLQPRRRLFSKTEEENMPIAATVPLSTPVPSIASSVPSRVSGCRSSSETSVFDFRESDSEGEMPVLERQTLEGMRRDRKQLSKVQPPVPLNDAMCMGTTSSADLVKIELKENDKINEVDPFWTATCDKFMEQLRTGDAVKKRGRKKRAECTITSTKVENASDDNIKESTSGNSQITIKLEDIKTEVGEVEVFADNKNTLKTQKVNTANETASNKNIKLKMKTESEIKKEHIDKNSDHDSDEVPLIERATRKKLSKQDSDGEDEETICRKRKLRRGSRIKLISSSGSESSSEESDISTEFGQGTSVADRLRARKRSVNNNAENEGMKLRSRDTTPHKTKSEKESKSTSKGTASQKVKPKPLFGDGSDFRPGWEEEVYVYKKSLRMPPRLITVSKPSRFHRLSTSLPDLDPGSPALSVSMDSSDMCLRRKRVIDSDMESNCSFSITGLGAGSKIDDEEATSSTTVSCPPKTTKHSRLENNSIVDVLAQKVGTSKRDQRRKQRRKQEKGSKILRKGNNELELLPTPSLTPLLTAETSKLTKGKLFVKNSKSLKPIKVTDSFLLGYFRKETVNNFRDTFKNNHALPNEFSTFVLKSRTRTETRVLKKQATIREVFGEDRPASAPPMQNHDDTSQDDDSQNETPENTLAKTRTLKQRVVSRLRNAGILRSHKAIVNSKRHLLIAKRRKDLLHSLAEKKLQRAKAEVTETARKCSNDIQGAENNELEDDNNESEITNKKKLKLRSARRKFRSGFDYIRRKKKPLKKDETLPKERKRQVLTRPSPESVADIQSEIRTWVIKKGVGETILHRAARLGYTDVAAYCLEKLNSAPSPKDNAGYTPLHEACSKGHLEIAKLLLAYGANASESANGGIRPLHEAAESGATELVRLLLSYGADPLLATYSGQTPLMLAVDTDAYSVLEQHLDDIQGRSTTPWSFGGPSSIFDPEETGYNPLDNPPRDSPEPELDEIEIEVSDVNLPVLFSLANDPDKWVLLQDLMMALRIKSRDALLRQVNPKAHVGPPAIAHRDVMREFKLPDFLEQSRCCHLLSGGERINVRGSKVTLIKYNDKVRSLLNVERVFISLR